ncbi:hypothetical protein G5V57_21985 [Nordella sp. HKS 07]|uniref:hypothetical protein n=1 Tax=Nordella sp. HKS 07 TaxID=2712222 RepID=UPI0013E0EE5F|nr:hypothetical protein [Nordella sp. HKS 07]QIG50156.1 hypothetical protein G5V57_21985 [Nordella sp. HKS 07]
MKPDSAPKFPSVDSCVSALTDTLVRIDRPNSSEQVNLAPIVAFLQATLARMPDYLRLVFRILTLVFDAWPLIVSGRPFHRLDLARRIDQVERWQRSRLTFRQALIAFYRSFVIFALYSELNKEETASDFCTKQD